MHTDIKYLLTLACRAGERKRQNYPKWIAITLLFALVIAVAGSGCTTRNTRTVAAEKFILVDADGQPKAQLGIGVEGIPSLDIYDRDGRLRIRLGEALDGELGLFLIDSGGQGPGEYSRWIRRVSCFARVQS